MGIPHFGAPTQLAALRHLLTAADFTAPAVCRRLGIEAVYDFRSIREGREVAVETVDRLDLLIRLFMDVELVERAAVVDLLSADGTAMLEELGLLSRYQADERRCHAAVLLYPVDSLWIVSDLNVSPAPSSPALSEDAVYPAITKNTRHFLSSLPTTPCETFLELCAGTGIAALLASRYAARTWAADITERATQFARFNTALNGIVNCTAVRGDLYEPVAGLVFDRIVAHPPYMPSLEQKYVFRDGGEDGEQITRRIIAGLPDHLAMGGRFYCTCILTDRKGARAEERVRGMLGERAGKFDVALVTHWALQPTEYYLRLALTGRASLDEVPRRHEIFQRLEVEHLVYCSMVVQHRAGTRPAFTSRRQAGPRTAAAEIDWLVSWETATARPEVVQGLIEAKPSASSEVRLRLAHRLEAGAWIPDECVLETATPFGLEAKCPPWTPLLIARCDGRRTCREHLQFLKQQGAVPPDAPEGEFVKLIRSLVAGGFLQLPEGPGSHSPGASVQGFPMVGDGSR